MTSLTRKSAILYLTLVFLAGALAGGAGGYRYAKGERGRGPRPPRESPVDFMSKRLKEGVGLTDEQMGKVRPILEKHLGELDLCNVRHEEEVTSIFLKMNKEMGTVLDEGQRLKLEEMEKGRQEWVKSRFKHKK